MVKQIAVAGKGGTGKTTFAALLLRYLMKEKKGKDLLAVDADANANLNEALGLEIESTIGEVLENVKKSGAVPAGMSKDEYIEYKMQQSLIETEAMDLLVMGNPQGPGCYCYPNDLLRKVLIELRGSYDYVIIDNEAGLEHLSRRIVQNIDYLVVTSDATMRGIRSAGRVVEIVRSVDLDIKEMFLVVSRVDPGSDMSALEEAIAKTGLTYTGVIPIDKQLMEYDLKGKALLDLPSDSLAVQAIAKIAAGLNL